MGVNYLIFAMSFITFSNNGPLTILFYFVGFRVSFSLLGLFDLLFLFIITIIIVVYMQLSRGVKYKIQSFPLDERSFLKYCESACKAITSKRIKILTTSTIGLNAFYHLTSLKSSMVVEKGLLLRFKRGEDISGIVAHESAHIERKDYWYITFLLSMTYAFVFLNLMKIVIVGIHYWVLWFDKAAILDSYIGKAHYLFRSIPDFLYYNFNSAMLIVVFSLLARHFIRLREFLTDEFAAQRGFRESIINRLSQNIKSSNSILSFHPSAKARKDALSDGSLWEKADYGFIFSSTFCFLIIINLLYSKLEVYIPEVNDEDFFDFFSGRSLSFFPLVILTTLVFVFSTMLILNHINRFSSTLVYKKNNLQENSRQMILCFIYALLGCTLSIVFNGNVVVELFLSSKHEGGDNVFSMMRVGYLFFFYYSSLIIVTAFVSSYFYMMVEIRSSVLRFGYLFVLWWVLFWLVATMLNSLYVWVGYNIPYAPSFYEEVTRLIFPEALEIPKSEFLRNSPPLLVFAPIFIFILLVFILIAKPARASNRIMPYGLNDHYISSSSRVK
ncbi:M48 family metalloprotease [Pantoea sp. At-9b]|uniref:M48 family metalloprotease n=1 Tax=Pantoea sp. (strain At-9b) TaxID=592316 RepID=UPI00167FAD06|nr:M48 family metalloprotease [Pantoea sp. At-9b]